MLYYSRMRWKIDGMSFDKLWKLEGQEAHAAVDSIRAGIVSHLYKPCAEEYVLSVGATQSIEDFDRYAMGVLPMREHLVFEEVEPLEEGFSIETFPYFEERAKKLDEEPRFLHLIELAWPPGARSLDTLWPRIVADLSGLEAPKVIAAFRVAAQQRALVFVDVANAAELNAVVARETLSAGSVTRVEALRDYMGFAEDVWRGYHLDRA
jgi:hypothetical protein